MREEYAPVLCNGLHSPDCGTFLCWQEDVEHASGWTSVMAASLEALAELQTDSTHGLCADFMAFDADAGPRGHHAGAGAPRRRHLLMERLPVRARANFYSFPQPGV